MVKDDILVLSNFKHGERKLRSKIVRRDGCSWQCLSIRDVDELFEFFFYEWNVSRMKEYIKEKGIEITTVPLDDFKGYERRLMRIDKSKVMNVDLSDPAILIELSKSHEAHILVDGCHRLEKSFRVSAPTFSFYKLSFEEQVKFLTGQDMFEMMVKNFK